MLVVAAALALATSGQSAAAPNAPPAPMFHGVASLAISPVGDELAAIEADEPESGDEEPHRKVIVRTAATGAVRGVIDPCPACTYVDPVFSPDGSTVAVIGRDRKAGTSTLYFASASGVVVRTVIKGLAAHPKYSPDGKVIAFQAVIDPHKEVGATQAAAPQVGEIGEHFDEQRIAVLAVGDSSAVRLVSPADTFIYEYDWTPDGSGFVATAAKGDGDNNWWLADLEGFDLVTGAVRRIARPKDQLNLPRVSNDGKLVAYIGGLMSDFGPVGGDVFVVPASGGAPVNLTPGFKGSFTSLTWRKGKIIATALISDRTALVSIDPIKGRIATLSSAPLTYEAGEGRIAIDARGEHVAAVVQDFEHAPEIAVGTLAKLDLGARITQANAALPSVTNARSVTWTSEGRDVQGWLLAPKAATAGGLAPMVVMIHGGPSSAVTPTFPRSGFRGGLTRRLLAGGYYVFEPNPRGSYGQGEDFTRANIRDFGGGDLRDILAGVDAVEKLAPVDDQRLGVMGHSYGGFMTMWTVSHSTRFHAAVSGAGIANWISYYGQNGIDQWMIPFFGASAYDDPAIYQKLSPLTDIKAAKTPTFIYVGERDVECPAPQSVEFWHALKAVGVATRLLILEGEGHGVRKPDHIRALGDAELGWFDHYLKAGGSH